jgi:hypothetical protein
MVRDSSSNCSSISIFSRNKYWTRSVTGTRRHPAKARDAARVAWSTSSAGDSGVRPSSSPLAGLKTGTVSVAVEFRHSPSM